MKKVKDYIWAFLSHFKYHIVIVVGVLFVVFIDENSMIQRFKYEREIDQLKAEIEKRLPKWETLTGLHCSSWQTKYMTTKWGTCNTKTGKIWINLQLAKKPFECLDYVLLHELAHLRVKDHGPEFTAVLDEFMPYWRDIRKELNDSTLDYLPDTM